MHSAVSFLWDINLVLLKFALHNSTPTELFSPLFLCVRQLSAVVSFLNQRRSLLPHYGDTSKKGLSDFLDLSLQQDHL